MLSNKQLDIFNETPNTEDIVTLNVGGKLFSTTKHTLLSINDTFFTVLLSGRLPSFKDNSGAIFIDRDPELFAIILNYLRTSRLFNINENNIDMLMHEAEFYGITPMVKQLKLYENLVSNPTCGGDILFQSLLKTNQPKETNRNKTQVKQIVSFDNGFVIVFSHYVDCYRLSDYDGWQCIFESVYIENEITRVDFYSESSFSTRFMLAICEKDIVLWSTLSFPYLLNEQAYNSLGFCRSRNDQSKLHEVKEIGRFNLNKYPIDSMFFIGPQLVALCHEKGRVGIWNSARGWLVQNLKHNNTTSVITAFDKAETDYLFLCSKHGTIYLIDMQKFPLRLKDGDLLINEFYKDPENEEIMSISCLLCPTQGNECFGFGIEKSIEIAYGTKSGTVRILVHHPETVGQGPQLFQTIKVHLNAISKIMLNNDYLITMCDKLHVRTWSLVRFRGLISTQPGTRPHSSFKIHEFHSHENFVEIPFKYSPSKANDNIVRLNRIDVGPYGHQKDGQKQVFIEMPACNAKYINILYASNGQKVCTLKSVDGSPITSVSIMYQHDVRYRQFIITGHANGFLQIWDLTTAMHLEPENKQLTSRQICKNELIKDIFQQD